MTKAKKWSFYWVATWKFLFSGGRIFSGILKIWWGSLLREMSKFLANGGLSPSLSYRPSKENPEIGEWNLEKN